MLLGGAETFLFISYLLMGPVVWVIYGQMINLGRRKMLLMRRPPALAPVNSTRPPVTILIPAKDEGQRIRSLPNLGLVSGLSRISASSRSMIAAPIDRDGDG